MRGDEMGEMIKKIDALSDKIDAVPELVQKEIKHGMILCGIDPKNPIAMQELVLWGRKSMEKEKKTSSRIRNNFTDIAIKGIVCLMVLGFISFYTQSLVTYAIREEQQKTIVVKKIDGHGE